MTRVLVTILRRKKKLIIISKRLLNFAFTLHGYKLYILHATLNNVKKNNLLIVQNHDNQSSIYQHNFFISKKQTEMAHTSCQHSKTTQKKKQITIT